MAQCFRCELTTATVQCDDCGSSDPEPVVYCDECSGLMHIGKIARHRVHPIVSKFKEQKEEMLKSYTTYNLKYKGLEHRIHELEQLEKNVQELLRVHERNIRLRVVELQDRLKKQAGVLMKELKEAANLKISKLSDAREKLLSELADMKTCSEKISEALKQDDVLFAKDVENEDSIVNQPWRQPDLAVLEIPSVFMEYTVDFGAVSSQIDLLKVQFNEPEPVEFTLQAPNCQVGEEMEVMLCSSLQKNGTFNVSTYHNSAAIVTLHSLSVEIRWRMIRDLTWLTYGILGEVPAVGDKVLAKHPLDKKWYRAEIKDQTKGAQDEYVVIFLDYGNMLTLGSESVMPYKDIAPQCPFQAFVCSMFPTLDVQVPIDPIWLFHDVTQKYKKLTCLVKDKIQDMEVWHVDLFGHGAKDQEKTSISDIVIPKVVTKKEDNQPFACRDIRYQYTGYGESLSHDDDDADSAAHRSRTREDVSRTGEDDRGHRKQNRKKKNRRGDRERRTSENRADDQVIPRILQLIDERSQEHASPGKEDSSISDMNTGIRTEDRGASEAKPACIIESETAGHIIPLSPISPALSLDQVGLSWAEIMDMQNTSLNSSGQSGQDATESPAKDLTAPLDISKTLSFTPDPSLDLEQGHPIQAPVDGPSGNKDADTMTTTDPCPSTSTVPDVQTLGSMDTAIPATSALSPPETCVQESFDTETDPDALEACTLDSEASTICDPEDVISSVEKVQDDKSSQENQAVNDKSSQEKQSQNLELLDTITADLPQASEEPEAQNTSESGSDSVSRDGAVFSVPAESSGACSARDAQETVAEASKLMRDHYMRETFTAAVMGDKENRTFVKRDLRDTMEDLLAEMLHTIADADIRSHSAPEQAADASVTMVTVSEKDEVCPKSNTAEGEHAHSGATRVKAVEPVVDTEVCMIQAPGYDKPTEDSDEVQGNDATSGAEISLALQDVPANSSPPDILEDMTSSIGMSNQSAVVSEHVSDDVQTMEMNQAEDKPASFDLEKPSGSIEGDEECQSIADTAEPVSGDQSGSASENSANNVASGRSFEPEQASTTPESTKQAENDPRVASEVKNGPVEVLLSDSAVPIGGTADDMSAGDNTGDDLENPPDKCATDSHPKSNDVAILPPAADPSTDSEMSPASLPSLSQRSVENPTELPSNSIVHEEILTPNPPTDIKAYVPPSPDRGPEDGDVPSWAQATIYAPPPPPCGLSTSITDSRDHSLAAESDPSQFPGADPDILNQETADEPSNIPVTSNIVSQATNVGTQQSKVEGSALATGDKPKLGLSCDRAEFVPRQKYAVQEIISPMGAASRKDPMKANLMPVKSERTAGETKVKPSVDQDMTAAKAVVDCLPKQDLYEGARFQGRVISELSEDGVFWLQLARRDSKQENAFKALEQQLQSYSKLASMASDPGPGKMVVAEHKGLWYRATIVSIINTRAHVILIDTGKFITVSLSALRELAQSIARLPEQAKQCCLSTSEYSAFSDVARKLFAKLTRDKILTLVIVHVEFQRPPYVSVFDCSDPTKPPHNIYVEITETVPTPAFVQSMQQTGYPVHGNQPVTFSVPPPNYGSDSTPQGLSLASVPACPDPRAKHILEVFSQGTALHRDMVEVFKPRGADEPEQSYQERLKKQIILSTTIRSQIDAVTQSNVQWVGQGSPGNYQQGPAPYEISEWTPMQQQQQAYESPGAVGSYGQVHQEGRQNQTPSPHLDPQRLPRQPTREPWNSAAGRSDNRGYRDTKDYASGQQKKTSDRGYGAQGHGSENRSSGSQGDGSAKTFPRAVQDAARQDSPRRPQDKGSSVRSSETAGSEQGNTLNSKTCSDPVNMDSTASQASSNDDNQGAFDEDAWCEGGGVETSGTPPSDLQEQHRSRPARDYGRRNQDSYSDRYRSNDVECHMCGDHGHRKAACPKRRQRGGPGGGGQRRDYKY